MAHVYFYQNGDVETDESIDIVGEGRVVRTKTVYVPKWYDVFTGKGLLLKKSFFSSDGVVEDCHNFNDHVYFWKEDFVMFLEYDPKNKTYWIRKDHEVGSR